MIINYRYRNFPIKMTLFGIPSIPGYFGWNLRDVREIRVGMSRKALKLFNPPIYRTLSNLFDIVSVPIHDTSKEHSVFHFSARYSLFYPPNTLFLDFHSKCYILSLLSCFLSFVLTFLKNSNVIKIPPLSPNSCTSSFFKCINRYLA